MSPLNIGIIGTGRIFDLNVLGYLNRNDINISCLCNRTKAKAEKKKSEYNLNEDINIYSDYKQMIDEESLDAVEILLPHYLHAETTIYAAKKGIKAISVQKPMAISLEQADKMIKACEEEGSILSVYENFVFDPHFQKAKELIRQDYIGDVSSIRIKVAMGATGGWNIPEGANNWREDPAKLGGSGDTGSPVLFDNGWHAFTLGWWFYEEPIEKVFAWTDSYKGLDAPAFVMWKCKYDKKKHVVPQYGNMEFSLMPEMKIPSQYYNTDEFIEIVGSRGLMKVNQGTASGNEMSESPVFPPIVVIRDGKVETFTDFELDWKESFIRATHHFIEVANGNAKPILSGAQAREILKFNLAAIKSAEKGREIFLEKDEI